MLRIYYWIMLYMHNGGVERLMNEQTLMVAILMLDRTSRRFTLILNNIFILTNTKAMRATVGSLNE